MSAMTDQVPSDAKPKPVRRRRSRARLAEASMLPVVWVLLIVVFSVAEPSKFFTHADFAGILSSQATLVIVSLALLMPLTSGDFDLSVASNAGLSAMIVAVLNVNQHLPIVLSVVIALAAGAGIGFINGLVIIVFNVDAFIATLGMGTVLTGLTLLLSGENTINGVSNGLVSLVNGTWFGISHLFYFAIVLTLVLWYVTEHTITGRRALFAGLGPVVAQLSGVKVEPAAVGCHDPERLSRGAGRALLRRYDRRRRPGVRLRVPAARVRSHVPGRYHYRPRPVQCVGNHHRHVFSRHRIHRPRIARCQQLGSAGVLRWHSGDRRGARKWRVALGPKVRRHSEC